jgi:hypothetical protein
MSVASQKFVPAFRNGAICAVALFIFACNDSERPIEKGAGIEPAAAIAPAEYIVPDAATKSLLKSISASRTSEGLVLIQGVVLLPKGAKVGVDLVSARGAIMAQAKTTIGADGAFAAGPFSDSGRAPKAALRRIRVYAYFNAAWQTPHVLQLVGESGSKMPPHLLAPDDAEFPSDGGHFESVERVQFPALTAENVAVEEVKNARLTVPEQGRSAESVAKNVAWFVSAGGVAPGAWSATEDGDRWIVTFSYVDGHTPSIAQWEYLPRTDSVRYLDAKAKLFSWLPSD